MVEEVVMSEMERRRKCSRDVERGDDTECYLYVLLACGLSSRAPR